jgi:hypothetical protein
MDRFLRYNRSSGSNVNTPGGFGNQSTQPPTIIVQPSDPPPIPAFIQNQSLEARVACDPSNQPALEATVRGRAVLKSDYGDGTNGYTKIEAPSSNSSLTAGPGGLIANTPGIGVGAVMTCMDTDGLAYWQPPTELISATDPATCFIRLGAYNIHLETNFDQPAGKLRLRIQTTILPGQVLTSTGNDGECQWVDLPAFPEAAPLPSIFASTLDVALNTTPTVLYPGILPLSTVEYWSATVDTTFISLGNTTITWALYDSVGVNFGASVTTNVSNNSVTRLTYTYTFRKISTVEVRMTATATIITNGTVSVTNPVRYLAVNTLNGMPFPRASKGNAGVTVTAVSRNAFYNVLNWTPPVAAALLSITPDPSDAIVEISDFDVPSKVVDGAVVDDESVFTLAEEGEIVPSIQPEVLESVPPVKRQKRM